MPLSAGIRRPEGGELLPVDVATRPASGEAEAPVKPLPAIAPAWASTQSNGREAQHSCCWLEMRLRNWPWVTTLAYRSFEKLGVYPPAGSESSTWRRSRMIWMRRRRSDSCAKMPRRSAHSARRRSA